MSKADVRDEDERFKRCLVGGTFDHLHIGHHLLLETALKHCDRIEVWLTDDVLASAKGGWVQSWKERSEALEAWFEKADASQSATIHRLFDEVGPAPEREDCDAIICTPETRSGCDVINEVRRESGLAALSVMVVEHVLDPNGQVISSSRIRAGEIDREGIAWLDPRLGHRTLYMPASADEGLKQPLGTLFEGPEDDPATAIRAAMNTIASATGDLVAVGDVCVAALRSQGIIPDIAVVDGRTKRTDLPEDELPSTEGYDSVLHCSNPAGCVTPSLSHCLQQAVRQEGSTLVNVEGEEDLAPLVLHASLPLDAQIFYGQPGAGVVLCRSSEYAKARSRSRLAEFTQSEE